MKQVLSLVLIISAAVVMYFAYGMLTSNVAPISEIDEFEYYVEYYRYTFAADDIIFIKRNSQNYIKIEGVEFPVKFRSNTFASEYFDLFLEYYAIKSGEAYVVNQGNCDSVNLELDPNMSHSEEGVLTLFSMSCNTV